AHGLSTQGPWWPPPPAAAHTPRDSAISAITAPGAARPDPPPRWRWRDGPAVAAGSREPPRPRPPLRSPPDNRRQRGPDTAAVCPRTPTTDAGRWRKTGPGPRRGWERP